VGVVPCVHKEGVFGPSKPTNKYGQIIKQVKSITTHYILVRNMKIIQCDSCKLDNDPIY
jgi:hypothetical protein